MAARVHFILVGEQHGNQDWVITLPLANLNGLSPISSFTYERDKFALDDLIAQYEFTEQNFFEYQTTIKSLLEALARGAGLWTTGPGSSPAASRNLAALYMIKLWLSKHRPTAFFHNLF